MQRTVDYLKKLTGYKTVSVLPYSVKWLKTDYSLFDVSPEEFLGLYNGAQMVVSASFHGTAFAHIFGKTVYACVRDGSANRINDIMTLFGVPDFCISENSEICIPDKFDRDKVDAKLALEREKSLSFLRGCLSEDSDAN